MEDSNKGFIVINRKIREWEWIGEPNTCLLWFHILLMANWSDGRFQGVDVPKGSFITSVEHLSKATGLSVQNVRTALKHLENTGEIERKVTNRFTHIFVINWAKYQFREEPANKQLTNDQQTTNNNRTRITRRTIKKKYKKEKERERVIKENPLSQQIGSSFSPPTVEQVEGYVRAHGYRISASRFVDYYESNGWMVKNSPMKDWKAAVRSWEALEKIPNKKKVPVYMSEPLVENSEPITDEEQEELMELMERSEID